ncbi:hypothetical protein BD560DRAFT_401970 [Blakeslea trispora]|nr:hypothetical protein BD560DRAFT_401970 [Blakeslea trispora]
MREEVLKKYRRMSEELMLPSGVFLEDVMKEKAASSVYVHPSHYFIFDPSLGCYDDMLSEEDIVFVVNYNKKTLLACPDAFKDAMKKFIDEKTIEGFLGKTACHVFCREKYDAWWLDQSIINAMSIFMFADTNILKNEGDVENKIWSFVFTCFKDIGVTAVGGEHHSASSSSFANKKRKLDGDEKITRKKPGNKADITFLANKMEIGCAEFALSDDDECTKVIREVGLKCPAMLKIMLEKLGEQEEGIEQKLNLPGLLIYGNKIVFIFLDMPNKNVARVTKVGPLAFPSCVEMFAVPALKVFKQLIVMKQVIKNNLSLLSVAGKDDLFE